MGQDALVELVALRLLPLGPAVLVDEVVLGQGQEPGREVLAEVVFRQGAVELEEDLLGPVLRLLAAAAELIGHVKDPPGVSVHKGFPGYLAAFQAVPDGRFQIHSIHLG